MKVAVFGLGYVGSVTSAGLAVNGHEVCGVDVDAAKVDTLNAGRSPVVEPGLDDMVKRAVDAGALTATTEARQALDRAEVSIICVGTPSDRTGGTDLTYIRSAVDSIIQAAHQVEPPASGIHTVAIRSTVPPGTVDEVVGPQLAAGLEGTRFAAGTAMCPEFLREGSSLKDFFAPPLVVAGTSDERVAASMRKLFAFLGQEVQVVNTRTAEALKYACNAFHATKVSFANEMGRIFRHVGVDSREVMELFVRDTSLNVSPAYLRPGFAFGGSCLPKDLRSVLNLARENSADLPMLAGVMATNELVISDIVNRVVASPGREVAILGLSFKSETDDLRESPSVEMAERLLGKGYGVRIYDSVVNPSRLVGTNKRHVESKLPHLQRLLTDDPTKALEGADIALVSTADRPVVDALATHPPARTFDLSGRLGPAVEALPGYEGVGW